MPIELDYAPPNRSRWSPAAALTGLLVLAVLLNWPCVYVYLYEKARLAADPHAYPHEWMGRQPDFVFLWWLIGAVARVPLAVASLVLWARSPAFVTLWRCTAVVALLTGVFAFEFSVSFYERLIG